MRFIILRVLTLRQYTASCICRDISVCQIFCRTILIAKSTYNGLILVEICLDRSFNTPNNSIIMFIICLCVCVCVCVILNTSLRARRNGTWTMTACDLGLGAPPGELEFKHFVCIAVWVSSRNCHSVAGAISSSRKTLVT